MIGMYIFHLRVHICRAEMPDIFLDILHRERGGAHKNLLKNRKKHFLIIILIVV